MPGNDGGNGNDHDSAHDGGSVGGGESQGGRGRGGFSAKGGVSSADGVGRSGNDGNADNDIAGLHPRDETDFSPKDRIKNDQLAGYSPGETVRNMRDVFDGMDADRTNSLLGELGFSDRQISQGMTAEGFSYTARAPRVGPIDGMDDGSFLGGEAAAIGNFGLSAVPGGAMIGTAADIGQAYNRSQQQGDAAVAGLMGRTAAKTVAQAALAGIPGGGLIGGAMASVLGDGVRRSVLNGTATARGEDASDGGSRQAGSGGLIASAQGQTTQSAPVGFSVPSLDRRSLNVASSLRGPFKV